MKKKQKCPKYVYYLCIMFSVIAFPSVLDMDPYATSEQAEGVAFMAMLVCVPGGIALWNLFEI